MYACSELAQHLIRAHVKSHSWTLETYPGKVRLPQDILRALPSPEAGKKILHTVYLPETAITWLTEKAKANGEPKEKKPRAPRQPGVKRKAAASKSRSDGAAKYVTKYKDFLSFTNDLL